MVSFTLRLQLPTEEEEEWVPRPIWTERHRKICNCWKPTPVCQVCRQPLNGANSTATQVSSAAAEAAATEEEEASSSSSIPALLLHFCGTNEQETATEDRGLQVHAIRHSNVFVSRLDKTQTQ